MRPRNFDRDLPVHQMQSQFSPAQGVYNHGPYNPRIRSPSLMHPGQSGAWNGSQATDHYNLVSDGTPRGMYSNPPRHPRTSQRVWNPSNTSTYGNLPGPYFSLGDGPSFNYGTARPQMFGNRLNLDQGSGGSAYFSPGRGRSRGYTGSSTPGLGRSVGRGQGFRGRSSASNRILGPESYFDQSMLEDPWQHLEPIPWKRQEAGRDSSSTPGTSNSWLPKSIDPKKAKFQRLLQTSLTLNKVLPSTLLLHSTKLLRIRKMNESCSNLKEQLQLA
ncbi:protein SICKLE-like [Hibiscus syriacus]|uniref:protein SICKLE-like n=1 Tax=Hibiscus syriacus TaxID=106335 RepID=UPI0019230E1C|nr:protein SICKLE-like [Hibiscus syriacus]